MPDHQTKDYPIDPKATQRLLICELCKFTETTENGKMCSFCGCLIKGIVNQEEYKCPLGKW